MGLLEHIDPPACQQPPAAQNHHMVADRFDVGEQVAREQQAHSLVVGQVACQFQDLVAAGRVHAVGGLVEDQKPGVVHQRPCDLEPLLHAGGIRLDPAVSRLAEPDVIEHFVSPPQGVAGLHSDQFSRVGDKLDADQARKQTLILRYQSDHLANGKPLPADVHSQHPPAARVDPDQPQQRPDHRRLAGPVGAKQARGAHRKSHRQILHATTFP